MGRTKYNKTTGNLEHRLQELLESGHEEVLDKIISADYIFYEKLFFIIKIFGEKEGLDYFTDEVMSKMPIGRLISEMLKPQIARSALKLYPSLDLSLVFNRNGSNGHNYENAFSWDMDAYSDGFWKNFEDRAKQIIEFKYNQGLLHFAEVISLLNGSQPFLKGNPKIAFQSNDELDYVVKLYNWATGNSRLDADCIQGDLKEFMEQACSHGIKRRKFGKRRTGTDYHSQLAAMKETLVTIIGLEYPAANQDNPVLITFRAKSLKSTVYKLYGAYAALVAFHGRGIAENVYLTLPSLLDEVVLDMSHEKNGRKYKRERDSFSEKTKTLNWEGLAMEEKARLWSDLPSFVRSKVVSKAGNYGSLIEKYNTWDDVVSALNDLFGITITYGNGNYNEKNTSTIINPLYGGTLVGLRPADGIEAEEINNSHYGGTHFGMVSIFYSEQDPTIQPIEVHITSLLRLLINDSIGQGSHTLYSKQKIRELLETAPEVETIIENLKAMLDNQYDENLAVIAPGYLAPLRSQFPQFLEYLQVYGMNIDAGRNT